MLKKLVNNLPPSHLHCKLSHIGASHRGALASSENTHGPDVHAGHTIRAAQEHPGFVQVSIHQLIVWLW